MAQLPPDDEYLTGLGWKQGSLLPTLTFTVVCDPRQLVTPTSRNAPDLDTVGARDSEKGAAQHYYASSRTNPNERLILISQTCDIARPYSIEPTVLAARAFYSTTRKVLEDAAHSVRTFLVNPNVNLVVDIQMIVQIEKPVLISFEPEQGPPDDETAKRFRRWIGMRFSRSPFPTGFESAVRAKMAEALAKLAIAGDHRLVAFRAAELRIVMPSQHPPFSVEILCVIPPRLDTAVRAKLEGEIGSLLGELVEAIESSNCSTPVVTIRAYDELTAEQYLSTVEFRIS